MHIHVHIDYLHVNQSHAPRTPLCHTARMRHLLKLHFRLQDLEVQDGWRDGRAHRNVTISDTCGDCRMHTKLGI